MNHGEVEAELSAARAALAAKETELGDLTEVAAQQQLLLKELETKLEEAGKQRDVDVNANDTLKERAAAEELARGSVEGQLKEA